MLNKTSLVPAATVWWGVKTVVQVLGDANGDLATLDRFARFAVISLSAGVLAAVSASREYGADHYQRQEKSQ